MRLRINKSWVLLAGLTLGVSGVTGAAQYYIWDKHTESVTADYEEQIALLNETIDSVGPMIDVYTVRAKTKSGDPIIQEDLVITQVTESTAGDAYVLDPTQIVGKYYKIAISPGTPITTDLVMSTRIDNTSREIDMVADVWPVGLKQGDYIDVEITYPNGEKFTVISKKRVDSLTKTTVKSVLNGTERYLYNSALVDYFVQSKNGAVLTFVKYVEPGVQEAAKVYYAVPENIISVMAIDPNIVEKANSSLMESRRSIIEASLKAVNSSEKLGESLSAGRQVILDRLNGSYEEYMRILEEAELTGELEGYENDFSEDNYTSTDSTSTSQNQNTDIDTGNSGLDPEDLNYDSEGVVE